MKLNKIEKIVVIVILLGIILVGGGFMFVMPSFENIGKNGKTLEANLLEKAELDEKLSRLDTIDADIEAQKKDAIKFEGGFYPDLTTYEASEIAMAYLNKAGLEAHTISISPLSTVDLTLEYYDPEAVTYDLKTYGDAVKNGSEEETVTSGTFMDGNKKYSIAISSITDVNISDENGNVIAPAKYTETMKKVYKAAVCSLIQAENTNQTVATVQATYEVTGKFKDYVKFIDHMYSLERATLLSNVEYPMTIDIQEDKDSKNVYVGEDGSVSQGSDANGQQVVVTDDTEVTKTVIISFMCVEPMNKVKSINADGDVISLEQRPTIY